MRKNLQWGLMMLPMACWEFMDAHRRNFTEAKGSSYNHQAWMGGYEDHLDEVFGIASLLYRPLNETRPLPFRLSDAVLVLWLHDLEKVWKNSEHPGNQRYRKMAERSPFELKDNIIDDLNLNEMMTDEHWNALEYVHGELDDYAKDRRVSGPLGAFVHMCDCWSARGWHDEPHKSGSLRRLV